MNAIGLVYSRPPSEDLTTPFVKTHIVPAFLADAVVEAVATECGEEHRPIERMVLEAVPLDPGGIVYRNDVRRLSLVSYEVSVVLCTVPDLMAHLDRVLSEPEAHVTYGGVPCVRLPDPWNKLSIVPETDLPAIKMWIRTLFPFAIEQLAREHEASKDSIEFGPGRRRTLHET